MKFFRSFIANSVFTLNVLLLFLLIFRQSLDVPSWLQSIGRMHPMLLHIPIGLLVLTALMVLFRKGFKKKAFQPFLNFVLCFSAFTSVLTALMGLLLSAEGGYDEAQLALHLAAGVAVSVLSWWLLIISIYLPSRKPVFNISLVATIIVVILAGDFGSVLTRGENFVSGPMREEAEETVTITDSTALYLAAIQPVLKSKCMGCHNERKAKGNLVMTSIEKITKGGKHGPIWEAHNPDKSTIIKRIHLPEENDDHMPPSGKPQLSKTEKQLLYRWILEGADLTTAWTKFSTRDSLRYLANEVIQLHRPVVVVHYGFPFASKETIQELNTPFRTLSQFASDEPALKADFFLSQSFNSKSLEELLRVKEQLVILNLAKMPVTDADGKTIAQFKNLEKLNLNQTGITGNIFGSLKELTNLKSLSLTGAPVDKKSLTELGGLASLKEVFLWNTKLSVDEIAALQKQFPTIAWDAGYQSKETLRLTPPLLVNESFLIGENEFINLKHNLPGTQIRYTTDGTEPDSVSGAIYEGPVALSGYTVLKTKAFKQGWYGSPGVQFYFFKEGVKPETAKLLNPPNKEYKGEGAITLINNKKGTADNFKDIAWVGYRGEPFEALFQLADNSKIGRVTLSYCENAYSFILPPASAELWTGNDPGHLKLLKRLEPQQPAEKGPVCVKGIEFKIPPTTARYYKIIAQPVARVPVWVAKKPEKGWVLVDEVIFN